MIPELEDIRSLGDFAPEYKWELSFMEGPLVTPDIQALNFRCTSSTIPTKSIQRDMVYIRGHVKNVSGPAQYDTITLDFIETVDNTISQFLSDLHNAAWEANTGNQRTQADIEMTIRLTRMDREANAIWAYQLYGCWLEGYMPGRLTDQIGFMRPSLTFCYDYFEEGYPTLL